MRVVVYEWLLILREGRRIGIRTRIISCVGIIIMRIVGERDVGGVGRGRTGEERRAGYERGVGGEGE